MSSYDVGNHGNSGSLVSGYLSGHCVVVGVVDDIIQQIYSNEHSLQWNIFLVFERKGSL